MTTRARRYLLRRERGASSGIRWGPWTRPGTLTRRSSGGGPDITALSTSTSDPATPDPASTLDPAFTPVMTTSRDGWALIRAQMRHQWKGLLAGVTVGLVWTAAKVSVPKLVQQGIDKGIEA